MCLQAVHFLQNNPQVKDSKLNRHFNVGHALLQFLHYYGIDFRFSTVSIW